MTRNAVTSSRRHVVTRSGKPQWGGIVVGCRLWVVGCGLSVVGCRLWVVGCGLSVVGCGLSVVGCRLWVVGCGLSVVGCPLSVVCAVQRDSRSKRQPKCSGSTVAERAALSDSRSVAEARLLSDSRSTVAERSVSGAEALSVYRTRMRRIFAGGVYNRLGRLLRRRRVTPSRRHASRCHVVTIQPIVSDGRTISQLPYLCRTYFCSSLGMTKRSSWKK